MIWGLASMEFSFMILKNLSVWDHTNICWFEAEKDGGKSTKVVRRRLITMEGLLFGKRRKVMLPEVVLGSRIRP